MHLGPRPVHGGDLDVCLVYPNVYPVGMANLGFQAVYSILAAHGVSVERAFLPDAGASRRARSLESGRPLSSFDVLAFSISFESDYVHLVDLLAGAGLDPWRAGRDERAPLVMAGGPATFLNPEPIAPFVDLFLIGEAEEMLVDWLRAVRACGGRSVGRPGMLEASADVGGAYLPDRRTPGDDAAPRVRRR